MRRVIDYFKATAAFVRTLFVAKPQVIGVSPNGHLILEGWERSPEEHILDRCEALKARDHRKPRVGLYCFTGSHAGETFLLANNMDTIGKDTQSSCVVTPLLKGEAPRYRILNNGSITLMADAGNFFFLNGVEEQKKKLFDYDELELLGNKFLVFDLKQDEKEVRRV